MRDDPEHRLYHAHDDPAGVYRTSKGEQSCGWLLIFLVAVLVVSGFLVFRFPPVSTAKAQEAGDFPNCAGWIPHSCSCTSNSCYRAREGEVQDRGDDTFRVTATGEIVRRTDWSKDGRFMLCAYKRNEAGTGWITGPGNPIRCVFPPLPAS